MPRPQDNIRRQLLKRGRARELRSSATEFERRFWSLIRKQIGGFRFRRQQTIGPHIVDFYCSAAKLVIELDGGQHTENRNRAYDSARTDWLSENHYRVLRFTNIEFLRDPELVIDTIWRAIEESGVPLPEAADAASTLPQAEGGGLNSHRRLHA